MPRLSKFTPTLLIVSFLFSAFFILFLNPSTASAAIVKCGRTGQADCQICDIFVLVSDGINFLVTTIVPAIATLLFLFAGFLIILGGATPAQYQKGKDIFKNTCIGLLIIYGAWLIANTVIQSLAEDTNVSGSWFTIQCTNPQPYNGGVTPSSSVPPGTLSATDAWTLLDAAGIDRNKEEPLTSFEGMRPKTVQEIIDLKNACNCDIVVTGGTESTGHSTGTYSHANGYKFDVRPNTILDSYITSHFTKGGIRSDGAQMYTAPNGVIYAKEGDHWDVAVIK